MTPPPAFSEAFMAGVAAWSKDSTMNWTGGMALPSAPRAL